MIINNDHKFVFVHIPKCAGTSVRTVLKKFDSTQGFFSNNRGFHPDLGQIDLGHIPLSVLREYYPDTYEKIKSYFSFTVMRDPYSRFSSSLSQHLIMYGDKPFKYMKEIDLLKAVDDAIDYLSTCSVEKSLPFNYIHFQSQHSYIFDQGEQQVQVIYDIKNIKKIFDDLGKLIGQSIKEEDLEENIHIGKAMSYRTDMIGYCLDAVSPKFIGLAHRFLPKRAKDLLRSFIYLSRDEKFQNIFEAAYVKEFISKYYAEDIKLYHSVLGQKANCLLKK
jgi:hypothetical protein